MIDRCLEAHSRRVTCANREATPCSCQPWAEIAISSPEVGVEVGAPLGRASIRQQCPRARGTASITTGTALSTLE